MRMRPALAAGLVLLLPVLFGGCLVRITTILAPSTAVVDEDVVIAVDGSISGGRSGRAALIIQIPSSFSYVGASMVSSTARRPLRRDRALEKLFRADSAHTVIALSDSAAYLPDSSDDVRVFFRVRPSEAGTFSIKMIAAARVGEPGESEWRALDPQDVYAFSRHEDANSSATITVTDLERNGTTALEFSGERQYVALPDTGIFAFTLGSDWSVECWMQTTARDAAVFSTRVDDLLGAFPFELCVDEFGTLVARSCDGERLYATSSRNFVADGRWHHAALVYTAASRLFELYLDSRFIGSYSVPERLVRRPHAAPLLGARASRHKFFEGVIDELRIWSSARTQDEVMFYMNTALSGFEKSLVVLYSFENSQGGKILNTPAPETYEALAFNKPKLIPSAAPLKVELLSFTISQQGSVVEMTWESYDESKIRAFQVERRTDEGKYAPLVTLEPQNDGSNHRVYHASDTWNEKSIVYYRLRRINLDGSILSSDEVAIGTDAVLNFTLGDTSPNPFGTTTEIPYTISETAFISLRVYDIMGREIQELVAEKQRPGSYTARFDGTDLPPGLYFYKMRTSAGAQTKKMYLAR